MTNFIKVLLLVRNIFKGNWYNVIFSKHTFEVGSNFKVSFRRKIKVVFYKSSFTKSKSKSHAKQTLNICLKEESKRKNVALMKKENNKTSIVLDKFN